MTPLEYVAIGSFSVLIIATLGMIVALVRERGQTLVRERGQAAPFDEIRSDFRSLSTELGEVRREVREVRDEVHEVRRRLPRRIADRYDLVHLVGEGSAGRVWRATDSETGNPVAVKLLRRDIAEGRTRARFLRESEVAKQLRHPHIVRTYDAGEDASGQLYIVMELLDGRTLRDVIEQRSIGVTDMRLVVQLGLAIAHALIAAGERSIVHRDIKPENICMPVDGRILLADFGLGFVTSSTSEHGRLTEEGVISGTPHYMSPEQCRGDVDLTQATDVYALGCVLYEVATGLPPYTGAAASAIMLQHSDRGKERPRVPGHPLLASVLRAMMAFSPEDRPTPERVVRLLDACMRGETL